MSVHDCKKCGERMPTTKYVNCEKCRAKARAQRSPGVVPGKQIHPREWGAKQYKVAMAEKYGKNYKEGYRK